MVNECRTGDKIKELLCKWFSGWTETQYSKLKNMVFSKTEDQTIFLNKQCIIMLNAYCNSSILKINSFNYRFLLPTDITWDYKFLNLK